MPTPLGNFLNVSIVLCGGSCLGPLGVPVGMSPQPGSDQATTEDFWKGVEHCVQAPLDWLSPGGTARDTQSPGAAVTSCHRPGPEPGVDEGGSGPGASPHGWPPVGLLGRSVEPSPQSLPSPSAAFLPVSAACRRQGPVAWASPAPIQAAPAWAFLNSNKLQSSKTRFHPNVPFSVHPSHHFSISAHFPILQEPEKAGYASQTNGMGRSLPAGHFRPPPPKADSLRSGHT